MEMQEMEITIDRDGNVSMHVQGMHGSACRELTQGVEERLGTVTGRKYLPEYYETVAEEFAAVQVRH